MFSTNLAAGAGEVVGFGYITTMQQMTTDICGAASIGATTRLMDTRDNKWYWVTKLKDEKCWMTQNLALDLSKSKTLVSGDSDVVTCWTPTADTQQGTIAKFPSSSDLTFSYNPREYVYTTPTTANSCGQSGISSLSQCTGKGWIDVNHLSPSIDPDFAEVIGDSNSVYNAHYLAGNYYSYYMATAGYNSTSGTAPSSICPKGWRLPTGGNTAGEFYNLLNGLTVKQITSNPYYFVYGGRIENSSLINAGSNGHYWSGTTYDGSNAYYLQFVASISPLGFGSRFAGLSVRCVAK